MELFVTLILGLLLIIFLYLKFNRNSRLLKNVPGPPTTFLLGNALDFPTSKELLENFTKYTNQYGGIVKVAIGPVPTFLVVTDYRLIELLLSSPTVLRKSTGYKFFYDWLGKTGLLLSEGDSKWKFHRKILTPTFHFKILNEFTPIFENFGNIFVDKLRSEVGKPSFNIHPYVTLLTLDVICETAMGTSVNAQLDVDSDYVKSVATMCSILIERTFDPLLMINFFYKLSSLRKKETKAIKILHAYVKSVIADRKREFSKKSKVAKNDDNEDIGMKRRLNFLDVLLEYEADGQRLTDEDIREEVDTFMFAGHDTTASAVSFTLYSIAQYPDVQQKIMDEIVETVDNYKTASFGLRDLQNMKYLEAVIKESLRLYPSVPVYGRNPKEDIQFGDLTFPKGLDFLIFAYGAHRNPKFYPNPEQFMPERYFSENSLNKLPYEYLPFSAGPRNCIGQKFAMLEMKSIIITVLKNYKLLPSIPEHKLDLVAEVVLTSKNGICLRLEERKD